jgi:hypothetical protein
MATVGIANVGLFSGARGRSERMFGTLQERLPKELKLAGITIVAAAGPNRRQSVQTAPIARR